MSSPNSSNLNPVNAAGAAPSGTAASRSLVKRAGFVSIATLVSRLLGYARDALIAYAFGGGAATDVFYAAFRLPNLFRRFLGEGSLTPAFVPVFAEHIAKGEREEARRFFQALFTVLGVVLIALVALGVLFAPAFVHAVAWGFKADPAKFDMTVRLTRLTFPFLFFICLAALSTGALNALGHFFRPSLAPAMLSVAEIAFVLFLIPYWKEPLQGLALSALAGGILHFAVLLPLLKRENLWPQWSWQPKHPDIQRVGRSILPVLWGLSMDQINAYVDTICASFLISGSVTALYNSNRLMQFPLALFGIATSTAALPSLSASHARGDRAEMKGTINLSLRLIFFSILPAMTGLIVLSRPIIQLLFEHGRFTPRETDLTAAAMTAFSLGLPAFAGVKVAANAFYAMKDTKTPVRVATLCLFINMAGNVLFMRRWGVGGLAFATTLASLVNACVLFWLLRKRLGLIGGRKLLKTFLQSAVGCAFMAAAALSVNAYLPAALYVRLPAAVLAGVGMYALAARVLRMDEFSHVEGFLLRRKAASAG